MAVVIEDANVRRAARRMRARGKTVMRAGLPPVGEAMHAAVLDVFEAQGPGWPGFAESTLMGPRGRGSPKLLQDSGAFANTQGIRFGLTFVEVFATVPYGVFHASDEPRSKLPQRNPYDLGPFEDPFLQEAEQIMLDEMTKVFE